MDSIVITGAGIVSAIGIGKAETLDSLREQRSGIAPLRYLKTAHTEFPVGEVKLSDDEMKQRLGISTEPTTRTALLGMLAMDEALQEAGLSGPMGPISPISPISPICPFYSLSDKQRNHFSLFYARLVVTLDKLLSLNKAKKQQLLVIIFCSVFA